MRKMPAARLKKDDADNSVKIETVVNVAANTKLSAIAKNFHGFKAAESDGFIKVPAGFFKRSTAKSSAEATGSNTHAITLTKDLYVCDHEVTQGEWCWDLYESPLCTRRFVRHVWFDVAGLAYADKHEVHANSPTRRRHGTPINSKFSQKDSILIFRNLC